MAGNSRAAFLLSAHDDRKVGLKAIEEIELEVLPMLRRYLLVFTLFSTSAVFATSANAQSTSLGLGVQLTASDATILLGESIAISGDSLVVAQNGNEQYHSVYVFQRKPGGALEMSLL